MTRSRQYAGWVLLGVSGLLLAPSAPRLAAQDAPARRDVTIVVQGARYSPARVEVALNDLVTLTVRSEDGAHSFAIDEYRIARRIPAGGSTTFEFRADREGRFPFYCNLTGDAGHRSERGELVVVRGR